MSPAEAKIDFSKLVPIELMFGEDIEETQQLVALFEEAELYLASFGWCAGVRKAYFGLGVSDFIGIFLFELTPNEGLRDRYLWVVSGDVPPAYLVTDDCPNSVHALQRYIQKMNDYCAKASAAGRVDAGQLRELMRRIALLDSEVLSHYKGDLA